MYLQIAFPCGYKLTFRGIGYKIDDLDSCPLHGKKCYAPKEKRA